MGTEILTQIVVAVAKVINVVYGFIAGTGGFMDLVGMFNNILALKALDFKSALAQLKDLDGAERVALEQAFESALVLPADAQSKVAVLVNSMEDLINLVYQGIAMGEEVVALVARVRSILGV